MKDTTIIECTLRDGSYAIDYQFTAEDTAIIVASLEQAGFGFIEIGHGLGLNASNSGKGTAAASDEEYLEAASRVLKKAKFGMFFIPGIGREEDLRLAARYGMDFVRIGTNITEVEESARYVELAKSLGMKVSANLMKSYALSPAEFLNQAKKSEKYGADIIVVVDSAGGMLPQDVVNYVSILKNSTDLPIGYHGHNNLGLAISNTLEAIKSGATVIDSTLRGMGRSAGNAQTEILVLLLEKMGYSTGIDVYKTMDIAERLLRPLMREAQQGIDSIGAISGYAQFHSSFLGVIYRVAKKYNIDPRELIVKVSEIDRVHVSEELAEGIAREVEKDKKKSLAIQYIWSADFQPRNIAKKKRVGEVAQLLAKELFSLSKKSGKFAVFTIAGSPNPRKRRASFPFVRQNSLCIIGNAEVTSLKEAVEIAQAIDSFVDVILIDAGKDNRKWSGMLDEVRSVVKKSRILTYKDSDALVNAADVFIGQLALDLKTQKVAVLGGTVPGCKLAFKLAERGYEVTLWGKNGRRLRKIISGLNLVLGKSAGQINVSMDAKGAVTGAGILVGIIPYSPIITSEMLELMSEGGLVIDAGIGTLYPEAIEYGNTHGIRLYRLDMRAGLSGELTTVLESSELTDKVVGIEEHDGIRLVAGGIIGRKDDIVVDSISQPTRIIGVADGRGGLLDESEKAKYRPELLKVRATILEKQLLH